MSSLGNASFAARYKGRSAERFSRSRAILREVLGVLFDLRQLRQGFLPNQKLLQSGLGITVQRLLDDFGQPPPFRRQSLDDDGLQGVVSRSNHLLLPQQRDPVWSKYSCGAAVVPK